MTNIIDFWRNEWNAVADMNVATEVDDMDLFVGEVINNSNYVVYYKPEDGSYGSDNKILPYDSLKTNVDGLATCKYKDKVYKVPGKKTYHPVVKIDKSGDITFRFFNEWPAQVYAKAKDVFYNENYEYGCLIVS